MKNWERQLPFGLVVWLMLVLGATNFALGVETRVMATLLAPLLWLGLDWLGAGRARGEE